MKPNYVSELYVKVDTTYDTGDKCKSIKPMKQLLHTDYVRFSDTRYTPGICFLCNLNLPLNDDLGRHVRVICVLLCYKKCHSYTLITGDGICRRDSLVVSCGVVSYDLFSFSDQNLRKFTETKILSFEALFAEFTGGCFLDNLKCVRRRESRRDDDVFVSVNKPLSFRWNCIYWDLRRYPFLWPYCDIVVHTYLCVFHI